MKERDVTVWRGMRGEGGGRSQHVIADVHPELSESQEKKRSKGIKTNGCKTRLRGVYAYGRTPVGFTCTSDPRTSQVQSMNWLRFDRVYVNGRVVKGMLREKRGSTLFII